MSEVSVLLTLRPSERCLAPSGPSSLSRRLQTRVECKCYWLLTVKGKRALVVAEFGGAGQVRVGVGPWGRHT